MIRYTVIYEKGPSSWGAYVPDLPGVISVGDSQDEVKRLIQEAIELHLEGMREEGMSVPQASSFAGVVKIEPAARCLGDATSVIWRVAANCRSRYASPAINRPQSHLRELRCQREFQRPHGPGRNPQAMPRLPRNRRTCVVPGPARPLHAWPRSAQSEHPESYGGSLR